MRPCKRSKTSKKKRLEGLARLKRKIGDDLYDQLKPYQRRGVLFLERKKGRALLADDMGLGKTAQSLSYLQIHPEMKAVCIVPATVKWNWEIEAKRFSPIRKTHILNGRKSENISHQVDTIILNPDILKDWVPSLRKWGPDCIIIDEAHDYKNKKALRTKALVNLVKGIDHIIALTGTPVVNAPIDFYGILKILDPAIFPNFWEFAFKYCNARHTGWGWDFRGSKNERRFHFLLTKKHRIMLRRLKEKVLKDLPPITKTVLLVRESSEALEDIQDRLAEESPIARTFAIIEEYKQECLRIKESHYVKWIHEFLESTDEKLVVFAHHTSVVRGLYKRFHSQGLVIDGKVIGRKRQLVVEQFMEDPDKRLLFGNLKAAGKGITLTSACHCLFLELPWSPAELQQASDRLYRISQTRPVFLYYMLIADSIETDLMDMIDRKAIIISKILDGRSVKKSSLLNLLLKKNLKRRSRHVRHGSH